jgi:soluble P-type ATPase
MAAVDKLIQDWGSKGASTVCVLVDGQLVALLVLCDQLRGDACPAVAELQALGCYTAMLSGDNMAAATAIALELGLEVTQVFAELLPADKLQVLTMLRRGYHTVAHVGDGINDAPALAAADVGVAMGVAGSALAVDTADVALFTNDLRSLVFAVCLGRRVGRVVVANITLACLIKVGVLVAAAAGFASLWLSLLADVGASLIVTLHALTLLQFDIGWHPEHMVTPGHSPPHSRRSSETGPDACTGASSKPLSRLTAALRSSSTSAATAAGVGGSRALSSRRKWWPSEFLQRVSAPLAWWRSRRYESLSDAGALVPGAPGAGSAMAGGAPSGPWHSPQQSQQQQQGSSGLFRDRSRDLELGGRNRASPVRSRSGSPSTTPRSRPRGQGQQQQEEGLGQHTALLAADRRVPAAVAALFVLEDDE